LYLTLDMEGHFHVSYSPVPRLRNNVVSDKSANKTSSKTGKPIGFWYSLTLDWLPILDRNNAKGIGNAIRMSLGVQNMVNAAEGEEINTISRKRAYVYSLTITNDMKTKDIHHKNPNLILKLSDENLNEFIEEFYIPYDTPERTIKIIQVFFFNKFYEGVDVESDLTRYFESIESPDESIEWYETYTTYIDNNDKDGLSEFIEEYSGEIINWLNKSIEEVYTNEAIRDMLLDFDVNLREFIEGQMWSAFWKDSIAPRFAGVEFTQSVVNLEGGPIWSRFLEIPSGCLFRPAAMRIEINPLTQLSLDPANAIQEMNVFGKTRNNGTVKRVRVRAMPGGSRKRVQGRKWRKGRKGRKGTQTKRVRK
jgi:hypothetical protein